MSAAAPAGAAGHPSPGQDPPARNPATHDPAAADPATGDAEPLADRFRAVQERIGWRFGRPELLREALTHRSAAHAPRADDRAGSRRRGARRGQRSTAAANRGVGSNERLEFIGDRVLGLLMAEWLIERFPAEQEGALGPRLAQLVSRPVLAGIAVAWGFRDALLVAAHEERAGVRDAANVLADSVEAVLGAVYLDGGLDPARSMVRAAWADALHEQVKPPKDPKTALQEWLMARGMKLPCYSTVAERGPSHAPHFTVRVEAAGELAEAEAGTKRAAESLAATALLGRLA